MGGVWLSQDERLKKTGVAGIEAHSKRIKKTARHDTVSPCDEQSFFFPDHGMCCFVAHSWKP